MNTLGIIIGRMQPPHLGHKTLIDRSLAENNTTLVLLGGNGDTDYNNPYSFEQRDIMLQNIYPDENLMIDYLYDTPTDLEWVQNINFQVYKLGVFENIRFYAGDMECDSAIDAIKKHQDELDFKSIVYTEIDRKKLPISSTLVRDTLSSGDIEVVKTMIPKEVYDEIILK